MTERELAVLRDSACAEDRILEEADSHLQGAPAETDVVEFEGEHVVWGSLTVQDRKAYFASGYPF